MASFIHNNYREIGFHQAELLPQVELIEVAKNWRPVSTYTAKPHFHPYIGEFIAKLNRGELKDLLEIETQKLNHPGFFEAVYNEDPDNSKSVNVNFDPKEVDFDYNGPYALYNRELFHDIPIIIANQLRINQRFAEAQKWFHFVFDPTTDEAPNPLNPTARYWKFLQFRENADPDLITDMLFDLADGADNEQMDALKLSILAWKRTPFSPHEVAKFRPLAYQFRVVMDYISNLIEWGDSLFRQFSIESINEAEQLYILAKNILGDKPEEIPRLHKRTPRTYHQIKDSLDEFGNLLVEMENEFPLNTNVSSLAESADPKGIDSLLGISRQLYFCIPENKKLLSYWTLVDDRLFKIRNCMDIEGNIRPLPLFQPPIDPGMLVKAAASGMSLSSILSGLHVPVSCYRFTSLIQKALQLCNEVKSLGSSLLSAIEKGDAERLNIIRQEHELAILRLSSDIKFLQWKESESATSALLKSRESSYQKYRHYQLILGKDESEYSALEDITIDRTEITEENFDDRHSALVEQYGQTVELEDYREDKHGLPQLAVDVATEITGAIAQATGAEDLSGHFAFNTGEKLDLNVFGPLSTQLKIAGFITKSVVAPLLGLIPQFDVHGTPLGVGGAGEFGGVQLEKGATSLAEGMNWLSQVSTQMGEHALKLSRYQRRVQDWIFQNNLAAKELRQYGQQIISSIIREQISKKDYDNHQVQIEQSETVEAFLLEEKFSSEALYLWMQNNLSTFYHDCYNLAYDIAKQAEQTLKHELMRPELDERTFIQPTYWDGGHKGLLAGEALYYDLQRLELAYLDYNKREFELTKHISIARLNPLALLELKATGRCTLDIPEWLFDLDCPGHYMRRVKTVSLSIPCVAGPYTSINCTLSLQRSSIRTTALVEDADSYERTGTEDERFRDVLASIETTVTSSPQNDSGLFELNLNDERFLPFENNGAISTWSLELPNTFRQFDYNTITDIIVHMRYTARQGGALLKEAAENHLTTLYEDSPILSRMFSLQHDFPNDWHSFEIGDGDFTVEFSKERLDYISQSRTIEAISLHIVQLEEGQLNDLLTIMPDDLTDLAEDLTTDSTGTIAIERALIENLKDVYMIVSYAIAE